MVRTSQATTFSSESYFDDHGVHGYAQPITEHVNVRESTHAHHKISHFYRPAPFTANCVILLPGGCGGISLWHKSAFVAPPDVISYSGQQYHPMKPHRLTLINALMIGYRLDKQIHQTYNPPPASRAELLGYHDKDYINFLSRYVCPFAGIQNPRHPSHGPVDPGSLLATKMK